VRVTVIGGLAALAWLAWHPGVFREVLAAPTLVTQSRQALAPGVSLRVASVPLRDWRVIDFEIDLTKAHLEVGTAPGGGFLSELIPDGAIAAVNGAFFEADSSPHGWLVDRGVELHPKRESSPHHLFAARGTAVFCGRWESLPFEPLLAMQNFPLLVENGAARIQESDSDPGYPRTFACDSGGGVVLLPVESSGPSMFVTAKIAAVPRALGGFGCVSAVNLDGGGAAVLGDVAVLAAIRFERANEALKLGPQRFPGCHRCRRRCCVAG
jgi:hypothetical protein